MLNIRDVGRPLMELLFDEKEENRDFAARILILMDRSNFLHNLISMLKEDKPRTIHPQLARIVSGMGREAVEGALRRTGQGQPGGHLHTHPGPAGDGGRQRSHQRGEASHLESHPDGAGPRLSHPGQDRRGRSHPASALPRRFERRRGRRAQGRGTRAWRHLRRPLHRRAHQHPRWQDHARQGGLPGRGSRCPGADPPGFREGRRRHAGPAEEEDHHR